MTGKGREVLMKNSHGIHMSSLLVWVLLYHGKDNMCRPRLQLPLGSIHPVSGVCSIRSS